MKASTKKKIGYGLLVALLIIIGGGFYIYKEYNRRLKDTSRLKSDFVTDAASLIKEFENGDSAASRKYLDKVIEVSGTVKEVSADEKGFLTIVLGDSTAMSSVRCSVDSSHNAEMAAVRAASPVIMKGICTGFNRDELLGSDIILVRSVLKKN